LEKLTDDFEDRVDSLTWSPDDQQIAFIAYNEDYQQANIYTLNFETRSFTKLTKTSAEYDFLRWSPNGEQLAFASSASGDWDIYVMDSDGSNLVNLTSNANQDDGFYGLSWSPDGSQIVFSSGPINGNFELFIMDTDGSNLVRLTENELHDTNPIWSAKRDY
jgi:Tol biopolymer transport system component